MNVILQLLHSLWSPSSARVTFFLFAFNSHRNELGDKIFQIERSEEGGEFQTKELGSFVKIFNLFLKLCVEISGVLGNFYNSLPFRKQIIKKKIKRRRAFTNLFLKLCESKKWNFYVRKKFNWLRMNFWIPQGARTGFFYFRIKLFDGSELPTWWNFSVCFFSTM